MDDVSALFDMFGGKAKVTIWLASYVGLDGVWAQCDIANGADVGRVPARTTTSYVPEINEPVFVAAVDGDYFLLGPSLPKPAQGTVTSVGANTVTVTTAQGDITATVGVGTTLSTGQVVKLYWSGGAHVIAPLTAAPVQPTPPPAPGGGTSKHVDEFTAVDAGSFSGGNWWQPQPWASDTTLGAYFYGSKIRDTLKDASIQKIEMFASLASRFGTAPNIGYHAHASKPGGGPSIQSARGIAVSDGHWVTLPIEFGRYLATNVGGIGFAHGGFNKFRSLAQDARSGALRITSTY